MPEPDPQPADPPNPRSAVPSRVLLGVYWVTLSTLTHWPRLLSNARPQPALTDPILLLQPDKVMHIGAFGLLNLLLIRARLFDRRADSACNLRLSTLLAVVASVLDEWTQGFSPERTVSAGDMLANALGIVVVYLWIAGVPRPGGGWLGESGRDPGGGPGRWRLIALGVGLLIVCAAMSRGRWLGDGAAGRAVAGVLSFAVAVAWFRALVGVGAGGVWRWWLMVGVVLGLVGVAVGVEAWRMVGGAPISFGYLFGHNLGAAGLIFVLAVLADRRAQLDSGASPGADSDRSPGDGR